MTGPAAELLARPRILSARAVAMSRAARAANLAAALERDRWPHPTWTAWLAARRRTDAERPAA